MGAPLAPVPNVLKVFLRGQIDNSSGEIWGNVLHFSYTGTAPSNATCAAIATQAATAWAANMASTCPSPTELNFVQVVDLTSTTAGEGTFVGVHAGTRGDDSIPANAALLISYPSALRYKGGHPRTYLYVLGNADLNGAMDWSTAATAEVQTKWQAFLGAMVGFSTGGCTLSGFVSVRYKGKFLPNGGPPHYYLTTPLVNAIPVASATAQAQMASQRGRINRRRS